MKEKAQEIYSQYVTETYGDDLSQCGTPEDIARFKAWLEKRKQNLNNSVPFKEGEPLTEEEIHEFGIRIIYDYAKKEGYASNIRPMFFKFSYKTALKIPHTNSFII